MKLNLNDGQRFNLGIHGSHNGAVAISYGGNILEVIEIERWVGIKNAGLFHYYPVENPKEVLRQILDYFNNKYNEGNEIRYNNVMENSFPPEHYDWFNADNVQFVPHHIAHVSNVFYQTDYHQALAISFDGGSDQGYFNVFYLEGRQKHPILIYKSRKDLCVAYQAAGHYIPEIKQENIWWGNLVYAGKIMGLSAYGKYNKEIINKVFAYFNDVKEMFVDKSHDVWKKHFGDKLWEGQEGRDLAFAMQWCFESLFADMTRKYIKKYEHLPIFISGGGGMNVVNNSKFINSIVSPQSDDRGIALGCLLSLLRPSNKVETTYLGSEPYDKMPEPKGKIECICDIADALNDGKFIGLIQGRAEYGARALGNRSILAAPLVGVKDKINAEVKHREPFRPFAAMVRQEDAHHYFELTADHKWMTHNAKCRIPFHGITHEDGTCRIQTVTKEQNPFIYELLGHIPIILNTSFNIQGKPILNTYKEALWMKENTGLDMVITDKFLL